MSRLQYYLLIISIGLISFQSVQFKQHLKSTLFKLATNIILPISLFNDPSSHFVIPAVSRAAESEITQINNKQQQFSVYSQGMNNLVNGNFVDALSKFNLALQLDKTNADVYISRGITYEKLLKWEEAIADYKMANDIFKHSSLFSGDDPIAISNIANAETGLEQWEQALKDFTYSASLKSNYLAPQIGKAFVLYQLDRKDESFEYFRSLSSKYPGFADGDAALAVMYFERSNIKEAQDYWEEALENDSRYLDIDWLQDIRRWPPKLIATYKTFRQFIVSDVGKSNGF